MRNFILLFVMTIMISLMPRTVSAAVGCTLTNPAQDLKVLFPEMTTWREEAKDLVRLADGKTVYASLRDRLGSDLDPVYENYDTPYTLYTVFKGDAVLGIVHGVNVPGQGGVIQAFLAVEPDSGAIRSFFYQRLESPAASALRKKEFRQQFVGLTLADFYKHDYYAAAEPKSEKDLIAAIKPLGVPDNGKGDYDATLRGLRKNLVLLDVFSFSRRSEPFYERAREAIAKAKGGTTPPKGE